MAEPTITDISGARPGKGRGEFFFECDDGQRTSKVRVKVTAEILPGRIVHRATPDIEKDDGTVEALNLPAGEHTFMLGEADGDPAESLRYVLERETLRAHRAKVQLDALAAMDLPTPAEAAPVEVEPVEVSPPEQLADGVDEIEIGGAGNDVLAEP